MSDLPKTLNWLADKSKWYAENSTTLGVIELLEFQDKLATVAYQLASFLADLKIEYNNNMFVRRIRVNRISQGFAERMAFNKAKIEAELECEELFNKEYKSEADAYKCDVLLKQVNRILQAIQQRISFLKQINDTQ